MKRDPKKLTHAKCAAYTERDGVVLVCGRSLGHSVLKCWDPDEEVHFLSPDRVGFPKIQPLGVRKLRPIADQLRQALTDLRALLDPEDKDVLVAKLIREDQMLQSYLTTWIEGPLAEALGEIDPKFRAEGKED